MAKIPLISQFSVERSEICSLNFSAAMRSLVARTLAGENSARIGFDRGGRCVNRGIVCRSTASIQRQAAIEGLNIAEDVSQVSISSLSFSSSQIFLWKFVAVVAMAVFSS